MAHLKILMPFNFTEHDNNALDFAISTYADHKDAHITLYNAHTPAPDIDVRSDPVMERMRSHLDYLSKQIYEQKDALKEAREKLLQSGFSSDRVSYIFEPLKKDIAGDIIDQVLKGNFDVVILNRKPTKITRFFTRSVFYKIISTVKRVTVCVVN
ncbi:MAG: universal stress protein [Desulfobacterales bacterium]|nr:MAG: universal stress protein [Desulfobacterales bacterium]